MKTWNPTDMTTNSSLHRLDLSHLHDVILEVTGTKPVDDDEIREYWNLLPDEIQSIGLKWGCNDTVFRDKMYDFLINNQNKNK